MNGDLARGIVAVSQPDYNEYIETELEDTNSRLTMLNRKELTRRVR